MNVHFVYACRPNLNFISKIKGRFIRKLQYLDVPASYVGKRDKVDTKKWSFSAPVSITHNVYNALRKKSKVFLYDWSEKLQICGGDKDILIGHPFPDDDRKVWNSSCLKGDFSIRIALTPIHHQMAEFCAKLEPFVPLVDSIFGITGPYWWDTWDKSAFAHWKSKIIPIDMAIDVNYYPKVKKNFNPKGKRKFLFIGNQEPYKGVHLLSILFGLSKENQCVWVGAKKKLPNIDCRPPKELKPEYIKKLAKECDFFITMGVSDANPTTILEAMAWGFPVCCTPQSGYYNMPEIVSMSTTDMKHNLEILNKMQYASEDELITQSLGARALVEKKYTWNRFTETILKNIEKIAISKNISIW